MNQLLFNMINVLAEDVHEIAKSKGWWDEPRSDAECIALMHSELSEWLEYLRHGNGPSDHLPTFTGAEEEAADTIIRVLDLCKARGYRIGEAIAAKMDFNAKRAHRHGGKKF
jgi:NTP pyrophosphatase (non-canonical NTP hydrolase)